MTTINRYRDKIDGIPVKDALRAITLEIDRKDISGADRKKPETCVAAAACHAHLGKVKDVRVHLSRIFILREKAAFWERYETPKALRAEIIAFDRGGRFEPGTFVLVPPPDKARRGGARKVSGDRGKAASKRAKAMRHMTAGVRDNA